MEVKVRRNGQESTIEIRGSIRIDVARRLRNDLIEATPSGVKKLTVDLSGVDYTDSAGLATLLECMKRLERSGGRMVLCGVGHQVMEIFKIGQLDQIFDIESPE